MGTALSSLMSSLDAVADRIGVEAKALAPRLSLPGSAYETTPTPLLLQRQSHRSGEHGQRNRRRALRRAVHALVDTSPAQQEDGDAVDDRNAMHESALRAMERDRQMKRQQRGDPMIAVAMHEMGQERSRAMH